MDYDDRNQFGKIFRCIDELGEEIFDQRLMFIACSIQEIINASDIETKKK
jgi:hypothetical protein